MAEKSWQNDAPQDRNAFYAGPFALPERHWLDEMAALIRAQEETFRGKNVMPPRTAR